MIKIGCLTPSFNKPDYVKDAIGSVLNQTYDNFIYWIIENSNDGGITRKEVLSAISKNGIPDSRVLYTQKNFTDEERKAEYPTAVLLNEYLPVMAKAVDVIMYISDDDIFNPEVFKKVARFFEDNPDSWACYFAMFSTDDEERDHGTIAANDIKLKGSDLNCVIDGGQVAFRSHVLNMIPQPYFRTDYDSAASCDGHFLTKLSTVMNIDPIPETLLIHRRTKKSTWNKGGQ